MIDSTNDNFVFESQTMLTFLQNLLMFTSTLTSFGLFLGIYKNLGAHLPETIVTLVIAVLLYHTGNHYFGGHMAECMSLEFWHFPRWTKAMMGPTLLRKGRRERLRARAGERARILRERARRQRGRRAMEDPTRTRNIPHKKMNGARSNDSTDSTASIGTLLRTAAMNLGRDSQETTPYEERLEADWFNDARQLRGRDAECLARYMPLRLAEEVHRLLVDGWEEDKKSSGQEDDGDIFFDPPL